MMRKAKLTVSEQVSYMRDHCGIRFEICTENEAEMFLKNRNYFFKVKAFAKNFHKDRKTGKYVDLDFAHLVELSTLDALLRKEILAIAVDIEHFLRVGFVSHLSENESEDGYELIERFFRVYPGYKAEVVSKGANSYCQDLVNKLQEEGFAAWNVIELLSFGQFINLYKLYSQNNGGWNQKICNLLIPAKAIRNAAAHNNCLLNSIFVHYSVPYRMDTSDAIQMTKQVDSYVSKIPSLKTSKSRAKKLANPVVHDFVALLFLFDKVVTSDETKRKTYQRLHTLFHDRMLRRQDLFVSNEQLRSCYQFVVKIIDNLYDQVYNRADAQKSL